MFYIKNWYKDYYYLIDNKIIIKFNNLLDYYFTFASKKLNYASFDITPISKRNLYTLYFDNKEKDFYFPLLTNLSIYKY